MALIGESPGLGRLAGLRRHVLLGRTRPTGELLFELAQAARPILKLASALSRRDHDAARNMAHAHRGIRGIHALTSGSRCPKSLDIAIARKLVDRHRRPFGISLARNPRIIHFERPLPATRHEPMRPTQGNGLEPLTLQPSEHVAMNLALDGLVQNLMAHARGKASRSRSQRPPCDTSPPRDERRRRTRPPGPDRQTRTTVAAHVGPCAPNAGPWRRTPSSSARDMRRR